MRPVLFQVFGFPIHSFGVMMVIAFFAALWLIKRRASSFGFQPNEIGDVALYTLIAGVLGARVVFILQELPDYLRHPRELFTLQFQGLTSFGGLFVGMAVLIFWAVKKKHSVLKLLDLCAPAFILGHAIGRIGCLLNGCCYGNVCDPKYALGIHVDGSPFLHHPAQAYDTLMNLAALGILLVAERRSLRVGVETGLALVLHGIARYIYEIWRAGASSTYWGSLPITQAQAMAIGLILGGVAIIAFTSLARSRQPRPA